VVTLWSPLGLSPFSPQNTPKNLYFATAVLSEGIGITKEELHSKKPWNLGNGLVPFLRKVEFWSWSAPYHFFLPAPLVK
jgi:hypothetical protein